MSSPVENHISRLLTVKSVLGQFLIPPLRDIVWQYCTPSLDMLIERIRRLMETMVGCTYGPDIKRIRETIKQTVAYWLFVQQFSWFNHLTVQFDDVESRIHALSNIAFVSENRQLSQLILLIFAQTTLINEREIPVRTTWNPPEEEKVTCECDPDDQECECYERHRLRPPRTREPGYRNVNRWYAHERRDAKNSQQYLLVMEDTCESNTPAARVLRKQTNLLRHAARERGSRLTHPRIEITVGDYCLYSPDRFIERTSLHFEPVEINAPRAIEMVTEFWALMNAFKLNMTPTGVQQLKLALQVLTQ